MAPKKRTPNPTGYGSSRSRTRDKLGGNKGVLGAHEKRTASLLYDIKKRQQHEKSVAKHERIRNRRNQGKGNGGGGGGGKDTKPDGNEDDKGQADPVASFSKGVSGKTQQFVQEDVAQSKYKEGASEGGKTGPTKDKKKKQRKKLVTRASKKSGVPRKKIVKALRTQGISAKEKALYHRVAKASSPKLSRRLRMADRRNDKKKKGKK